jgi:hypothetical protein
VRLAPSSDERPKIMSKQNESELKARAVIAGDLFREGRITRPECFRLEVDAATARDTGPIKYERNTEYADLVADGVLPNTQG